MGKRKAIFCMLGQLVILLLLPVRLYADPLLMHDKFIARYPAEPAISPLITQAIHAINNEEARVAFNVLSEIKATLGQNPNHQTLFTYHYLTGHAFAKLGLHNQAMASYLSAYELALLEDNADKISFSMHHIGNSFIALRRFDEAKYYLDADYQKALEEKSSAHYHRALNNLAALAIAQNDNQLAKRYLSQTERITDSGKALTAHSHFLKAQVADPNTSEQLFQRAIELMSEHQTNSHTIKSKLALADSYLLNGKVQLAQQQAQQALTLSQSIKADILHAESLLKLATLYEHQNNYPDALAWSKQYIEHHRHLEKQRSEVGLEHYIAEAELASKELDIALLTKEKQIAEAKTLATRQQTQLILVTSILVLLLSSLFFYLHRRKGKKLVKALKLLNKTEKALMARKNTSAMTTLVSGMAHQLNTPLGVVITANSAVKSALSKVKQGLAEKKLSLSELQQFITHTEQSLSLTEANSDKAVNLLQRFKLISAYLEDESPTEINLSAFFEKKISLLKQAYPISFSFSVEGDNTLVIQSYPDVLYKILEQLVENSCIHGLETMDFIQLSIASTGDGNNVQITYTDNGVGISTATIEQIFTPFFTTNGMQSRLGIGMSIIYHSVVDVLQGKIECAPYDAGARFIITLPITQEKLSFKQQ
ncbi:ATP-binding protein [Pseudoalteromonas sp. T1lg65]|uniref:ATP-binding protein n=1 Tax=Pseudoalteromonas sp. T1lg65 TaxID=2077101 RepID=UPI003F794973